MLFRSSQAKVNITHQSNLKPLCLFTRSWLVFFDIFIEELLFSLLRSYLFYYRRMSWLIVSLVFSSSGRPFLIQL